MILKIQNKGSYTVGGKAAMLCRLAEETTVNVPPFVMLPAETFTPLLEGTSKDEFHHRQALLNFCMSTADEQSLVRILNQWGFPRQPVVVRSSVADEDGGENAFAGLMDSFLNLTTLPQVLNAISCCAASAYSQRAMAYRRQKGLGLLPRPAVIVQQQITPVASGVLFTTFPDYPQEGAIHAVRGFGEGLVSGALQPDEFYYLKKSKNVHRQIISQNGEALEAAPDGGLQLRPITQAEKITGCLSPTQTAALAKIGAMLETTFGRAQDVEFVVTAADIFIVQSRPITQAIPEIVVWDNSNIQESYCGVTTPLTFSFATRAYATVYRQTMQTLGLPASVVQAHESVVTNLLGLVKGRIYYNINNWYRGLQLLPSFRQNKADMERMMGLEEPVDFVVDHQKTALQKLKLLPRLLKNAVHLLWAFHRLKKAVPQFHQNFQGHFRHFYQQLSGRASMQDLARQKEALDKTLLHNWTVPIINDFWVMMTNGRARRGLKKAGITNPEEFLSRYLSGDDQIESTQPVKAMQKLAITAQAQPPLQSLIMEKEEEKVHAAIEAQFPLFHQSVNAFINAYGDRTVGELKLETRTMRLVPGVFYRYLKNYLSAEVQASSETTQLLHKEAVTELQKLLCRQPAWKRKKLWGRLNRLQQAIRYRESLRLERTRLFGMYRAVYLAIGAQFAKGEILAQKRDIFYLTEGEINAVMEGRETANLKALVLHRRQEAKSYEAVEIGSRVVTPSPPEAPPETPSDSSVLQGSGCVAGKLTGEVIVIKGSEDSLEVQGKIVCALRTDPGWAVLFPTCKAVLIEKGSSLSHSVILLRELGIPTIINIPHLTRCLQTGNMVQINGQTGTINILSA